MENLESKIIAIIQNQPGVKARVISSKLGVDKTQVNSLLYGKLRNKVIQNKKYGWTLKSHAPEVKKTKPVDKKRWCPDWKNSTKRKLSLIYEKNFQWRTNLWFLKSQK